MTIVVALQGVESTGKSILAADLAKRLGGVCVAEYGRDYCSAHGTDCSAQDLRTIAQAQQAMIARACADGASLVIADTDWLMTCAWHRMMLGRAMDGPAYPLADLYIHLAADVPWIDDGLRLYADPLERSRFDALCRAELIAAGARWMEASGNWDNRRAAASGAIAALHRR